MNITLVVVAFPQSSETFIVNKFTGLVRAGYNVTVVCENSPAQAWAHFPALSDDADLRRRVVRNWPREPRWLAALLLPFLLLKTLLQAPRRTLRYLRRGLTRFGPAGLARQFYLDAALIASEPDVLHFEFGALAVDRMYLRDLLGCRVLVSFRGYDLNFSGLDDPRYYEDVWRKADHLHLLGEDLWARAQRRGCPPDKPHTLIPPAIDLCYFGSLERHAESTAGTPMRPLRVLSVGRLSWKKGYEYALAAIQRLKAQGMAVEFRIAGGGDALEALAFCRHELGLEEQVTFLGTKPREVILEQLQWADVFLHAAVSEGFCNAVIEAQAMQLPVVTSDADGLGENVQSGVTGYVVPRRDPAALAEKLLELSRDAEQRERMGQAGRGRAASQFDLDRQIERFAALYQHLAGGP